MIIAFASASEYMSNVADTDVHVPYGAATLIIHVSYTVIHHCHLAPLYSPQIYVQTI